MSVSFNAVPAGAIASGVFVEQEYKRVGPPGPIPQRIALLGQYNTGKTPTNDQALAITSADEAANYFGRGSMLHRMARRLFGSIGAGSVLVDAFPLAAGTGTSTGTITVTGTATAAGTLAIYIAGDRVAVAVASGDTQNTIATAIAAAITANLDLPVTAAAATNVVTLTARNAGLAANGITIKQNIATSDATASPAGVTLVLVAMSGGTADPSIQTALDNMGATWYTWVVCPYNAAASLTILEAVGDLRIGPSIKRPFAGVVGYNDTRANFLTWLGSRNSPWTTAIPVEGAPDHVAEIAAAAVGSMAVSAASEPARPFKTLALVGIKAGTAAPWTYAQRDAVEAAGGSSTYVDASGVVRIHDAVTTYVTNALGAVDESWRFTVTITNVQAKIYSLDQLFLSAPFDRGVVVDDAAVTSKGFAIRPSTVKAYIVDLIDRQWIPECWSKNRDAIVAGLVCEINASNPGRIDVVVPDIIAVGLRIVAVKYQWSFAAA
jgi:phage tail sheath gpL-like